MYLKNKLEEERINFEMYMEKVSTAIYSCLDRLQHQVLDNWQSYNTRAQKHLDADAEYNQLIDHFQKGDWTVHPHVDQSVNFLYSE